MKEALRGSHQSEAIMLVETVDMVVIIIRESVLVKVGWDGTHSVIRPFFSWPLC
jgi:hypothetical protein